MTALLLDLLVGLAALAGAWVLLVALYRSVFNVAFVILGRRPPRPAPDARPARFAVLIPAHDEELLIGGTIDSILQGDHPEGSITVHVVADNCSDRTAEVARAHGAVVLERRDPDHPGKGPALTWASQQLDVSPFDAVALIDADCLVDDAFFRTMSRELAAGGRVFQGRYWISNPDETLLTRLMSVTYVMKNLMFVGGQSLLGFSPILMGTGMVFARDAFTARGWESHSIVEDIEESFFLIEAGERIRFVPDAVIRAQEPASLSQGFSQRQRWATGQASLRGMARKALAKGLRTGNFDLARAALDLLLPTPYAKLVNLTAIALALAGTVAFLSGSAWLLVLPLVALALQIAEFALGLVVMRASRAVIASVVFAPVFLVWRGFIEVLALAGVHGDRWIRTRRHETR